MTQNEFAEKVGVGRSTVSRWVHDQQPSGEYIDSISDVLVLDYDLVATKAGYRPKELMMEVDPNSPEGIFVPLIRKIEWSTDDIKKMRANLEFMALNWPKKDEGE